MDLVADGLFEQAETVTATRAISAPIRTVDETERLDRLRCVEARSMVLIAPAWRNQAAVSRLLLRLRGSAGDVVGPQLGRDRDRGTVRGRPAGTGVAMGESGGATHPLNASSSRHLVTTSHWLRPSVGLSSSNPSKPS